MKNTIFKIGFLLLSFTIVISCESPEAEINYTPAVYEFPVEITLASSNNTNNSFDFSYTNTGMGEGYFVVVEGGSPAPSNQDIFEGDANGMIASGNFALTGESITTNISNLCNNALFDIYAVQFTTDSFLSDNVASLTSVTTTGLDIAGTYTANPFAFGEDATEYTATLTLVDGTTNQYIIDSAWGPNFVSWATGNSGYDGLYIYSGFITINSDNTIIVEGDDDSSWYATGGVGNFSNQCVNEFSYTLTQALFGNPFTTDVVLTQNQ